MTKPLASIAGGEVVTAREARAQAVPGDILEGADTPRLGAGDIHPLIGIGTRTFWRWVETGVFPRADLKVGKVVRWKPSTVRRWLNAQGAGGAA